MKARLLLTTSLLAIPAALLAAEFWQQKPAGEWSEKDCSRLVAKSPWAKDTAVTMAGMGQPQGEGEGGRGRGGRGGGGGGAAGGMGEIGGGGGMGSGGGMGGGGGRGGGGGGEMGTPQIPEAPHVVVRWESSAPVRAAMKKVSLSKSVEDADAQAFYIVSVDGIRMPRRGQQPIESNQTTPGAHPLPADQQDRLKNATSLTVKGKDPIQPGKIDVVPGDEGKMTFRFYFPRSTDLSLDDKEVQFQTRVGPMALKQKFVLKEMTFDGKLAL